MSCKDLFNQADISQNWQEMFNELSRKLKNNSTFSKVTYETQ